MAVSNDGREWFLLNASPDLRLQIERTPALQPRDGVRDSPISGVLLTSADIDQIAGLLSLRELQPFRVYCTPSLRRILREDNSAFGMLNRVPRASLLDRPSSRARAFLCSTAADRRVGDLLRGIFPG